jgi:hypothetical protein
MKKTLTAALLVLATNALAENLTYEQIIANEQDKILNLSPINPQESKVKRSLLTKIKKAKQAFREWKKDNPHHKNIIKEFRNINKKMTTHGSLENLALTKAISECKNNPENCDTILESNILSIYNHSEISQLAKKKNFKIIANAYANSASVKACAWRDRAYYGKNHNGGSHFFAGVIGADEACGLTFIGPGLGYVGLPNSFQICIGDGQGINVGPYASANAFILGVATGITVGEGGVCQMIGINSMGIGAFAGLIMTDDFGSKN